MKKINKGKRKNLAKRMENPITKDLNKKRGSALAETIILIAVSLVLAISLFYPEISSLLSNVISKMNSWVNSTMSIV